jgi:hypothetical protein
MAGLPIVAVFIIEILLCMVNLVAAVVLIAKHETIKKTRMTLGIMVLVTTIIFLVFSVLYTGLIITAPEMVSLL